MRSRRPQGVMCHHCGWRWTYEGFSTMFITCPHCHYKVDIRKSKIEVISPEELESFKPAELSPEEMKMFELEE